MEMSKIAVPTLIIQGDHDASIPAELSGQVCAALIPGSTFTLYENAPHGLYLSHCDRLTSDLLSFVGT
jgi:non-heme chloroperoxidase